MLHQSKICVMSPYTANVQELYTLQRECPQWAGLSIKDLVVSTIDSVQGQEYDLIIMILTKAESEVRDVIFLRNNNRLNVMASRPKWGTVLIADSSILLNPDMAGKKSKEYLWPLNLLFNIVSNQSTY